VRGDLEELIEEAHARELYTNLITSGIPLTRERLARFRRLRLDNVQLSIQDAREAESDAIAGLRSFERKLEVARSVKELGFPLTVNTVLHRGNLDRIGEVIALAEELRADRLELANAQYLGWALENRRALLPTAPSSGARGPSQPQPGWRSCSSCPTTIPSTRPPSWTAGVGGSWSSAPTG